MAFDSQLGLVGKIVRFIAENSAELGNETTNEGRIALLTNIIVDEADARIVLDEPWDSLSDMAMRTFVTEGVEKVINAGWPEDVV